MSNTPWPQIMEGLTGRRLAVHDDLANGVRIDTSDPRIEQALGWLVYHRLVEIRDDHYHAIDVQLAAERWRLLGPAKDTAADVGRLPHSHDPESPTRASAEAPPSSAGAAAQPAPAESQGERLTLEATPRKMRRTFEPPKKKDDEEQEIRLPDHPNQTTFL